MRGHLGEREDLLLDLAKLGDLLLRVQHGWGDLLLTVQHTGEVLGEEYVEMVARYTL